MIRDVLKLGDGRLLRVANRVESTNNPNLSILVEDLFDTMRSLDGAGIAAPQIGVELRIVVFGFVRNSRYPMAESIPETVLINPTWAPIGIARQEGFEGCLSVPGMRAPVNRWFRIRYRGWSLDGAHIDRSVSGFHARVVQHECDHLDGFVYPMRLVDHSKLQCIG